jgi:hypothetical protein
MPFVHDHCGGLVSAKTCKCDKCGKKWNWFKFWFDFPGMRKQVIGVPATRADVAKKLAKKHEKAGYATWADKLPGVGAVASVLPKWKRKYRIAFVLCLVTVIVLLVVFLS